LVDNRPWRNLVQAAAVWATRLLPPTVAARLGISAETVELIVENQLKDVYDVRVRFKQIFDTAPDRATAEQQLAELRARTESLGLDFSKFWTTYDNWKTGILNYFDGHYTSAAVEGINNKARVITKRCYGVKSAGTLWSRLILDLNRASEAVRRSIGELREIAAGLKAVFLAFCT
jgi:Transposase